MIVQHRREPQAGVRPWEKRIIASPQWRSRLHLIRVIIPVVPVVVKAVPVLIVRIHQIIAGPPRLPPDWRLRLRWRRIVLHGLLEIGIKRSSIASTEWPVQHTLIQLFLHRLHVLFFTRLQHSTPQDKRSRTTETGDEKGSSHHLALHTSHRESTRLEQPRK
jgi:nitrate reductase NapE component